MMKKAKLTLSLYALLLSACATSAHIQPSTDLEQRVNEYFRDCTERTAECSEEYFEVLHIIRREFEQYKYKNNKFNYSDYIWILAPRSISIYDDDYNVYMTQYQILPHCFLMDSIFEFYNGEHPIFRSGEKPITYIVDGVEKSFQHHLTSCIAIYAGSV